MSATDVTRIENKIAERISANETRGLKVGQTGLAIRDMSQLLEFAKIMAIGGVAVPKHLRGNPGACIAVCLQAIEWEMSPFAVANKSYSVNDRLAYEAQLIHAVLLKRAPIKGRPRFAYDGQGLSRRCTVTAVLREDGQEVDYTSPTFAEIAVKNSPLWKADLDQQLGYYSVRALARRHFPDVILGVIEREEARFNAIEGEVAGEAPAGNQPPPKADRKATVDERLAELAGGEPTPADDSLGHDPATGEIIEHDDPLPPIDVDEEVSVEEVAPGPPEHLLAAARKGSKALKFALGRLTQLEVDEIPIEQQRILREAAKMADRNLGTDET